MSLLIGRDVAHLHPGREWEVEEARAWAVARIQRWPEYAGPLRALVAALDAAEADAWERRRTAALNPHLNLGATR